MSSRITPKSKIEQLLTKYHLTEELPLLLHRAVLWLVVRYAGCAVGKAFGGKAEQYSAGRQERTSSKWGRAPWTLAGMCIMLL